MTDQVLSEALLNVLVQQYPQYAPQSDAALEAVAEGLMRLQKTATCSPTLSWLRVSRARRPQECMHGCEIAKHHWHYRIDHAAWGSEHRYCIRCLAMVLHLLNVADLPPWNKSGPAHYGH